MNFGRQGLPKLREKASIQRQPRPRTAATPQIQTMRCSLCKGSAGPLKFCIWSNSPFPDQCSVLCVCGTWFIQASAASHSRNLMSSCIFYKLKDIIRKDRRMTKQTVIKITCNPRSVSSSDFEGIIKIILCTHYFCQWLLQ